MNLKQTEYHYHLNDIIRQLSMYQALTFPQLVKLYPDLPSEKLQMLIRRLGKEGRLIYISETGLLLFHKDCIQNPATIAAFWVMLDFFPYVTHHSISEFPITLTFYTDKDIYDIIFIPEEKEFLIAHALSSQTKTISKRLVIINHPNQISRIPLPDISAFCMVSEDGQVQYYKKQGVPTIL